VTYSTRSVTAKTSLYQLGSSSSKVHYSIDKELQSIFGKHPEVQTLKAQSMGFVADTNLENLVKAVL